MTEVLEIVGQVLDQLLELVRLYETLPRSSLGHHLDVRDPADALPLDAQPEGAAERREFPIDGRRSFPRRQIEIAGP